MGGRVIRGGGTPVTITVSGPDRWSTALAASLAIATNTRSPMSVGMHDGRPRIASGVSGYGANRQAGRVAPLQNFASQRAPAVPGSRRLGLGAGVAGQPGLPGTSGGGAAITPAALMSLSQTSAPGWG